MTSNLQSTSQLTPIFRGQTTTSASPDASNVLGAMTFATRHREPHLDNGYPDLTVHMVGDDTNSFTEMWWTDRDVIHGERDGVVYAHDGENFYCAGHINDAGSYTDSVRSAYLTALGLTRTLGYHRIFRMWNFVEHINGDNNDGLEVYRDFCRGRAQAFDELSIPSNQLPAATGIGSLGGGIGFCLLASRSSHCINIENTRQTPAYRYPDRYGPRSPSFARATYVGMADEGGHIYVSGTASIVGHVTVHPGDVDGQCREALANIAHLLSGDNLARHGVLRGSSLTDLHNVKAYVRHSQDIATVKEICAQLLSPTADIAFFNVDICRSDLLVEIEGIVLT